MRAPRRRNTPGAADTAPPMAGVYVTTPTRRGIPCRAANYTNFR